MIQLLQEQALHFMGTPAGLFLFTGDVARIDGRLCCTLTDVFPEQWPVPCLLPEVTLETFKSEARGKVARRIMDTYLRSTGDKP